MKGIGRIVMSLVWMVSLFAPAATQDGPLLETELSPADGFRQTAWAEFQWRDDARTPTRRQQLAYDDDDRLIELSMFYLKRRPGMG